MHLCHCKSWVVSCRSQSWAFPCYHHATISLCSIVILNNFNFFFFLKRVWLDVWVTVHNWSSPGVALEIKQIKSVSNFEVLLKVHVYNEANVSIVWILTVQLKCLISKGEYSVFSTFYDRITSLAFELLVMKSTIVFKNTFVNLLSWLLIHLKLA